MLPDTSWGVGPWGVGYEVLGVGHVVMGVGYGYGVCVTNARDEAREGVEVRDLRRLRGVGVSVIGTRQRGECLPPEVSRRVPRSPQRLRPHTCLRRLRGGGLRVQG